MDKVAQKNGSGNHKDLIDRLILRFTEKMEKIPAFVQTRRKLFLLGMVGLTLAMVPGLFMVKMDNSNESFFREDDHSLDDYRFFKHKFGSDESLVIMLSPRDGDIFSPDSLKRVAELEEILNTEKLNPDSPLERITRVRSIISADYLESRGDTMISHPFIGDNLPDTMEESDRFRKLAVAHRDYPGTYFSKDFKHALIMVQTDFATRLADQKDEDGSGDDQVGSGEEFAEFDFGAPVESTTGDESGSGQLTTDVKFEQLQPFDYNPFVLRVMEIMEEQGYQDGAAEGVAPEKSKGEFQYILAGTPIFNHFTVRILTEDMGLLMILSLVLIFLLLAVSFRALSAMVWPLVIIILANVWTVAIFAYLQIEVSTMFTITLFLIITIGVASSVHILSGYRYFLQSAEGSVDRLRALSIAYKKSGFSIVLAALTTMVGLSALIFTPLVPIRTFGFMSAFGIFVALLQTLFLLPAFLYYWSPVSHEKEIHSAAAAEKNHAERVFQALLHKIYSAVVKAPVVIIVGFLVVTVIVSLAIPRVKVDTSFTKLAKRGLGFTESLEMIDRYFGGANSVEIVVNTNRTDGIKDALLFQAVEDFSQTVLKERPEFVPRINSIASAVKESYRVLKGGEERYYRIPGDTRTLSQVLFTYESVDPESRRLMVDDDWSALRISLQVYTKSSYEYTGFMDDLDRWIDQYFTPLNKPDLVVTKTGGIPMMMKIIQYISLSQLKSFALALSVVSVILLVVFGSVKYGLIAVIPNLTPIAVMMGIAGWFGIDLDTDTLIVMPLAIGIVVDDTIHFMTHYRAEIARGSSTVEAIEVSIKEVGQAMMFTSFILMFAFLIFLISIYIPFVNFGIMAASAIAVALLADLFLLPALLLIFDKHEKRVAG